VSDSRNWLPCVETQEDSLVDVKSRPPRPAIGHVFVLSSSFLIAYLPACFIGVCFMLGCNDRIEGQNDDPVSRDRTGDAIPKKGDLRTELLGKSIGDALDYFRVDPAQLQMEDAPPGKLRGVSFKAPSGGKNCLITLWIEYTPAFFSESRNWDIVRVRDEKVVGVSTKAE